MKRADCHIENYGGGCKVSPGALEHCYGIVVELLQQPRSVAPAALEKVYGGSCNLRFACVQGTFGVLWLGSRLIAPICQGPQQPLGNGWLNGGLPVKSMLRLASWKHEISEIGCKKCWMNHVGLPFYQEFGNKGGRRGLSQTCKEAVSVLKQQFREHRFQAILFYIHCLVAIQRNWDFRPEMCIDTIAQGNTVVQKIAKINTQKGQKHYSLAVLLPFHDDDCELCPAVLKVLS